MMHAVALFSVLFFALISFTYALPIGHGHVHRRSHQNVKVHHKRSSCPPHSSGSSSATKAAASSEPTALVAAVKNTKTSSASAASPSASVASNSSSSSSVGGSSVEKMLFPSGRGSHSWTTSAGLSGALPLSDTTFRPTKLITSLTHKYMKSPGADSIESMQAHYPKGSYTYDHKPAGGFSFYAPGPSDVDLSTAKEATLGYSVMFQSDFEWNMGGKLPGLYGGDNDDVAVSCSGGRRSDECFSARFMWRADGAGELYTYLPPSDEPQFAANKAQCNVPPESDCNAVYGASVGRGAFHFKAGERTHIAQRLRLNDVNNGKPVANGELELFIHGESITNLGGLIIRAREAGAIRGLQMQTFFGGHNADYASPQDQDVYFSDFSVAITEKQ